MVNNAATQLDPHAEGRLHPRTHLFVIAALYADGKSSPVHVRNMSLVGAQIEGNSLPDVGIRVILKRGSLEAHGTVAWTAGRRAGISFSGAVDIGEWMAKLTSSQDKVDQIVSDYRAKREPAAPRPAVVEQVSPVKAELSSLRDELAQLGNSLSGDVIMVATHPEIQLIDVALQRLERLIARF